MSKRITIISLVLVIVLISVFTVYAASVGWSWSRGSLKGEATGSGWGNKTLVTIDVDVVAALYGSCFNPGNGLVVPGQNPLIVTKSVDLTTQADNSGSLKTVVIFDYKGQTWGDVLGGNPSARDLGCPNDNWSVTPTIECVEYLSANTTVQSAKNPGKTNRFDQQSFDATNTGAFDTLGSVCQ
jgi:hypothetical protein